MKTIRALRGFASLHYAAAPGHILVVHDGAAADFVRAGHAEYVEEPAKPVQKERQSKRVTKKRSPKAEKKGGAD